MGMDSSSAQHHHQEMNCSSQTLESMLVSTKASQQQQQENKKPRPADMGSLNCPRCDSTNTKFCYYNNYSLSQPRYFCKSCRRYWTKGGTLRNVPVGGGCRKNKRPSPSSSCSSASSKQQRSQDHHPTMNIIPSLISGSNPLSSSYDSNDLTLAIARLQSQDYNDFSIWGNPNTPHHHHHHHHSDGFLETPPNGIENFYYGNVGMENGGLGMGMGIGMSEEMGIPFEEFTTATTTSTAVKQEMCGGGGMREGESTKVLFGFPWQNGGGGGNSNNNSVGEFDSGRSLSWNGISNGSSNWHGLLNSPLM